MDGPVASQLGGTDKAPTRLARPISAAAMPGRPADPSVPAGPRPEARLAPSATAPAPPSAGNRKLKAVTESIIDVGLTSPLVVNALEKLATLALLRKLPTSDPLDPSRKFNSPASPVVEVLVLGASPSQASSPVSPVDALVVVEVLAAGPTIPAWSASPSALVGDCGAVNGVNCVAALEALA